MTVGRNAGGASLSAPEALLEERGIDLVATDRGGDATYHGPGQLVGYAIVDIKLLHNDIHRFLREIEEGIIRTIARWGIRGERVAGRTGVWVGGEKLASIGLKASHWVTMHGLALNVSGDLRGFDLIVPCGIAGCKMTSMERLAGHSVELQAVGEVLAGELAAIWGRAVVEEGVASVGDLKSGRRDRAGNARDGASGGARQGARDAERRRETIGSRPGPPRTASGRSISSGLPDHAPVAAPRREDADPSQAGKELLPHRRVGPRSDPDRGGRGHDAGP